MIIVRKYINGKKVSETATEKEDVEVEKKSSTKAPTIRPANVRRSEIKRSGGCGCGK